VNILEQGWSILLSKLCKFFILWSVIVSSTQLTNDALPAVNLTNDQSTQTDKQQPSYGNNCAPLVQVEKYYFEHLMLNTVLTYIVLISHFIVSDQLTKKLDSQWKLLATQEKLITSLHKKKRKLQNQLQRANTKLKLKLKISNNTKQILSSAQRKIVNGKRKVRWSSSDIVKALSVRSVSLKSYETVRSSWGLPLPTVRTLQRWTQGFGCSPGIQTDVIAILKSESVNMDITKRLCALSFDEMSINSNYALDKSTNAIVSASKVQVVMARGICDGWKQPVFYAFDRNMTKNLLLQIITVMEKAGYPVLSVTCDLGAENRSLLTELGVTIDRTYFTNPVWQIQILIT